MTIRTKPFSELVQDFAAATQARCARLVDFTRGSVLRAVAESNATMGLYLQATVLQVLARTRASTSRGVDLDTWMRDFDLVRLQPVAATGIVRVSRLVPSIAGFVPFNTVLATREGLEFRVTDDPSHPNRDGTRGGYALPVGVATLDIPARCETLGNEGNVTTGAIVQIGSSTTAIDAVTNPAPFVSGLDGETDEEFRRRFWLYIASLSKATRDAVSYAVQSTRQGLDHTLVENVQYGGATDHGSFYVVVNDGSGTASAAIVEQTFAAVDAVRAFGIRHAAYSSTILPAQVAMLLTIAPGFTGQAVVAAVQNAIGTYISELRVGERLPYTRLAQIAYQVPGVVNVTGLTLNGGTADLVATPRQTIRASLVSVS
jgi:uncharacterized phage protein gp47/JayE